MPGSKAKRFGHLCVIAALAAMTLGVLGAPQLLLVARLNSGEQNAWYLRHAAPFLMIAMLVAAWTIL